MTKSEYKKEIYWKIIEKLKKDVEFYNNKAHYARSEFDRGKWIGIKIYCKENIKKLTLEVLKMNKKD